MSNKIVFAGLVLAGLSSGCFFDLEQYEPAGIGGQGGSGSSVSSSSSSKTSGSTSSVTTGETTSSVSSTGSSTADTSASSSDASSSSAVSSSASSSSGGPTTMTVSCGGTQTQVPENHLVFCWYFPASKHAITTVMKLGGSVNGGQKVTSFPGCEAAIGTQEYILCDLGAHATGADAVLQPITDDGFPGFYTVCDYTNLPNPKCYDHFWVWHDGMLKGEFDFTTGPSGPWSYVDDGGVQAPAYTE